MLPRITQYNTSSKYVEEQVQSFSPGAKANMANDSPVEAIDVTTERRLQKYWERMVTVGRKVRQYPNPKRRKHTKSTPNYNWPRFMY